MERPSRILWCPMPMRVVFRRPRARNDETTCVRQDTLIQVVGIAEEDAPEVYHLVRDGVTIVYREYANMLWRPLLDPQQRPLLQNAEILVSGSLSPEWNDGGRGGWADNPFGVRLNDQIYPDGNAGPPGLLRPIDEISGTVLSTNARDIDLAARRISSSELLEIGGVLHRSTEPPVWAIGSGGYGVYRARSLEAIVPDLYPYDTGLGRFGFDEKAMGLEVAGAVSAAFEARRRALGITDLALPPLNHEIIALRPTRQQDQRAVSLLEAVKRAEENLLGGELRRFPRTFLVRWGRLLDAVSQLKPYDKEPRPEVLSEAIDACQEIVQDPPAFVDTWPAGAGAIELLEVPLIRHRVETRQADDDLRQLPVP